MLKKGCLHTIADFFLCHFSAFEGEMCHQRRPLTVINVIGMIVKELALCRFFTCITQYFSRGSSSDFTDFFFIDGATSALTSSVTALSIAVKISLIGFFLQTNPLIVVAVLLDFLQVGLLHSDGFFAISASAT